MGSLAVNKRDKLFVSFCFCDIRELNRIILVDVLMSVIVMEKFMFEKWIDVWIKLRSFHVKK